MKVGYVRISTAEQNTARQDEIMKNLGVEKVYTDKMSGKSTERPELQKMIEFVREGDTLIVESISRDSLPRMMTVKQIAKTGILPENTIRVLLKRGELPAIYSGTTAYINFDLMCDQLRNLKPSKVS